MSRMMDAIERAHVARMILEVEADTLAQMQEPERTRYLREKMVAVGMPLPPDEKQKAALARLTEAHRQLHAAQNTAKRATRHISDDARA